MDTAARSDADMKKAEEGEEEEEEEEEGEDESWGRKAAQVLARAVNENAALSRRIVELEGDVASLKAQ
eukprot:2060590-Pyramimonas_sp.AAC.1